MIDLELLPDRTVDDRPRYRLTCAGRYTEGDLDTVRAWFTSRDLPVPLLLDVADEVLVGAFPGLVARLTPTAALLDRLAAEA